MGNSIIYTNKMDKFIIEAFKEAQLGLVEGGIPIGAILVIDGRIISRGHNRRIQKGSSILHAEMDCIEKAGRLKADDYAKATLYSTLSPCDMCSGAALLYKIPKIVIGDNSNFRGPEDYLRQRGVELDIANNSSCINLMKRFIKENPHLWCEDIGYKVSKEFDLC
jgi:cytosine/creatinine deaminase